MEHRELFVQHGLPKQEGSIHPYTDAYRELTRGGVRLTVDYYTFALTAPLRYANFLVAVDAYLRAHLESKTFDVSTPQFEMVGDRDYAMHYKKPALIVGINQRQHFFYFTLPKENPALEEIVAAFARDLNHWSARPW